ncbi:MAG: hypothetical protein JXR10_05695 [Cyclobacteriaceae bacterium]
MKILRLHTLLFIIISLLTILACQDEGVELEGIELETIQKIRLTILGESSSHSNIDPINIILEVLDESLEVERVVIELNDSIVQLTASLENWESPYTYSSYSWYDEETIPLGNYTIKATVYDVQGEAHIDRVNIEVVDYREQYLGDFTFTTFYSEGSDSIVYDGFISTFSSSDTIHTEFKSVTPTIRDIKIKYSSCCYMAPFLRPDGAFNLGRLAGYSGHFISPDTVKIFINGWPFSPTPVIGVRR